MFQLATMIFQPRDVWTDTTWIAQLEVSVARANPVLRKMKKAKEMSKSYVDIFLWTCLIQPAAQSTGVLNLERSH